MQTLTAQDQIATIARDLPATVRVFQRRHIDFCCGGKRPLAEACTEAGLAPEEVLAELLEAVSGPAAECDWVREPLPRLIAHILDRYHRPLYRDLPVLCELATKVADRHGSTTPALLAVREVVEELAGELLSHMAKEEGVLFPVVEQLAGPGRYRPLLSVDGPVEAMEHDHQEVAEMLRKLRTLTGGYAVPPAACNSFRGLFQMLADLDTETQMHIHLENNVLFPRALELAEAAS